jgi:DNA mismatch repair ATPase MutS
MFISKITEMPGILSFDYKLREGILTRSNALNIAHILGIDAAAANPIKPEPAS